MPWTLAYRPLRARGLLAQLAVQVVAEAALFDSYRGHESSFHWATHFLVGLSVAALTNALWLALKGAPARFELISILGWHLVAMFPDLLFSAGIPHDDWMDVFLGHISAHALPGGACSWLVIALALSGLYAAFLSRWLAARHAEAAAGLAPGIGIGGASLVRPQADPRTVSLSHTRYGPDGDPDVLLLHGLGASRAVWTDVAARLAERGFSVLVPDLLGFGASRASGTRFSLSDHVAAAGALLDRYGGRARVVAGHSFGCAVAVALTAARPDAGRALVLVSPPVFRDGADARSRLGQRGWLARRVLAGSPVASVACNAMCLLRRPAASLLARIEHGLPERVARDAVQHTWPSYRDALIALLDDNPLPEAIEHPRLPTTVVVGDRDPETPAEDVLTWPHEHVEVVLVESGDHLLPLRHADAIVTAVSTRLL